MGQYYIPMILADRKPGSLERARFAFYSHDFGCGFKLMEHSWVGNDFVGVVASFLAQMPGRVVWAGDYADAEPGYGGGMNLYDTVSEHEYTRPVVQIGGSDAMGVERYGRERGAAYGLDEVNVEARVDLDVAEGLRFFVNLDRGEYVDIEASPRDTDGWRVHPLPLLTAEGNGRGGGDYKPWWGLDGDGPARVGAELVGSWARDRIVARTDRPTGLREVVPGFIESEPAPAQSGAGSQEVSL